MSFWKHHSYLKRLLLVIVIWIKVPHVKANNLNPHASDAVVCVNEQQVLSRDLMAEQSRDSHIQRLWSIARGLKVKGTYQELQDTEDLMMTNGVICEQVTKRTGEETYCILVPGEGSPTGA